MMNLSAGSTIGPYRISSPLGKGGMGEVWRAHDSRLDRDVAIKALPPEFASDRDRLARFEREAKVLASLSHPNIAAIYGLEESAGARYLVLELVEGETLADRLTHGPIPIVEALGIALQIADAIEAAHDKDIIHRDLKPSNIKLTPDGKVKVLDFGLAKAMLGDGMEANIANSPTFSMAATAQGIILGTAAYMAPEQARGQAVDRRTDIWAFGCVLYEMLTGRPAFRGDHVSDILASVLAREPEFADLPATLRPRLKEALRRCLEKNPKRRWQAIGDLRVEIEQILTSPVAAEAPLAATRAKSGVLAVLPYVAAAAIVSAAAAWFLKPAPSADPPAVVRFDYSIPTQTQLLRSTVRQVVALSPDGRYFAYNAVGGVRLRSMDTLTSRVVPGTEAPGINNIFFSPDGSWLAYWAPNGTLQKIAVSGGAPVTIAPAGANPYGASWGRDGNILFAQPDGIWRVSADGGAPQRVIPVKNSEAVDSPSLLPDGKTLLYSLTRAQGTNRWDQAEVIAQRPGGQPSVLVRGGSAATYVPTGHLLYAVGNVLYAIAFDAAALETRGGPVPVVTGVQRAAVPDLNAASANYGVSDHGTLVYLNEVPGTTAQQDTLGIVDRTGAVRMLDVPKGQYRNPRVSPDGRQIVVESVADEGQSVIWVYDLSGTSAIRRLTQEGNNTRPVWTPDSKRIAFGSDRQKPYGIYWQPSDGSGLPERLTTAEDGYMEFPESFSPDGKVMSFAKVKPPLGQSSWGLYTVRLDSADRKPQLFYDLPNSNEFGSQFSPDGKWIAYASNAVADERPDPNAIAGFAIYLQPYPPTGVKYQITQTGGAWPIWSSNGREILYRLQGTAATGAPPKIYSVSITTNPTPTFTAEHPLPIQGFQPVINYREYDVLPNGRGLVMVLQASAAGTAAAPTAHISTVLNWFEELKARVPTKPR